MKIPIVAIIGRPNIGKSTLFNRFVGRMKAIVSKVAGTTRDRVYEYVEHNGHKFLLIDTAGIESPTKGDVIELGMQEQVKLALDEANIILFGVDGQTGFFNEDRQILKKLYKSGKPFFVFANKIDNNSVESEANLKFQNIGINIEYISSKTGRGIADFLDTIVDFFKNIQKKDLSYKEIPEENICNIAIVGKPNVGKSSLLNVFLGKDEALVSEVPGTTRDSIDKEIIFQKQKITLIDTAGFRRKTKIKDEVEKFSVLRAIKSIERADVILLVIDAFKGVTKQDMTISQLALDQYKSLILVANKWDLVPKDQIQLHEYEEYLRHVFGYMKWVPILFVSAIQKIRTFDILEIILNVNKSRNLEISTSTLNKSIQRYILEKPPQARNIKIKHPKIYYAVQTGKAPLEITLFVNDSDRFHNAYSRYLQNKLREEFNIIGTPIKIVYKDKKEA